MLPIPKSTRTVDNTYLSSASRRSKDIDDSNTQSELVRTNALSVLSHLILNDMVRVKGQISRLVVRLEDPSERIRTLPKVFFTEWGKRGNNPIYNVLPECISSLLEMPEINYEQFQRLIRFLIHFVEKVSFFVIP